MNEPSNKRAVIVGLFVLVGLLFLAGGILMVGNIRGTFQRKMQIVSVFNDVSGLQTGNNIFFSGVKIGTVSNLHFYGESQVAVSLKIETKAQHYIRKDAMVKISSDGLIGNKILVIYGGSELAEEVTAGDTLKVEKTFTSEDMINTLQENNKNILAITKDFKIVSQKLVNGEGTIGKLLNDNTVYTNISSATASLQAASFKAQKLMNSLSAFSDGLNKKGTLANELVTDTIVFNSMKASIFELQKIADTATVFITSLKEASRNPKTPIGVLLHDENSGAKVKAIIQNLEKSSQKLDTDLEAVQHNFLLKHYFKKKAKKGKDAVADSTRK
ncbi:MAG TPA: MlaD family protein [Cytophagaceae bacterium]|jgi:phospholipid/cholesterol/gamma-HCH transport system substrate-binding protein|nr:MlaD family protein [Cytophagaceae bacterium]